MAREVLGIVGAIVGGIYGGPKGASIGFAVGSTLGGFIDGPTNIPGPTLAEAPVQTSRDGVPIPIGWGIVHVSGNIIQKTPIVETTVKTHQGKGGGGTTTEEIRRSMTFAIGVCRSSTGPIAGIRRIWENDRLVYDTRDPPVLPAAETTKYAQNITIYYGGEDQLPDPLLEADVGVGNQIPYRGLAYIVWNNYDITDFGSTIPQYRFEVLTGARFQGTSHIYPIEARDGIDCGCVFDSGLLSGIPKEGMDFTPSFVSGDLRLTLYSTNVGQELDFDIAFVGGNLRATLYTITPGQQMDFTISFQSGDFRVGLIQNTLPNDKIDCSCVFHSGSMTHI